MENIIIGFFVVVLFIMPTIIAFYRKHHYRWIIYVTNIILVVSVTSGLFSDGNFGAISTAWLITLYWATSKNNRDVFSIIGQKIGDLKSETNYLQSEKAFNLLLKYHELHVNGAISDDEFNIKKSYLLSNNLSDESLKSIESIKKINELRENNVITEEEFQAKKQEILLSIER